MRVLTHFVFCAFLGIATAQISTNQVDPCDHPKRVTADIQYCDRYWECVGGVPQLYDCPNGLVFIGKGRGLADGCDYPWRGAYCQSRISGSTKDRERANPPISTENCGWLYGIFGHATSCTRYWTCWNGTSTEQFCIGGLLYNEETHGCDWPQNVEGCQKHPLCKDDPNANVPLGQSCERYWSCQGGYPRLQRCPATLVFDKRSRRCLSPPTEDCEVPPPPSTTPGPELGFRSGGGPPRRPELVNRSRQRITDQQQNQQTQQQFRQQSQRQASQRQQLQQQQNQLADEELLPAEQTFSDPSQDADLRRPRPSLSISRPRRPSPGTFPALPQGAIPFNFNRPTPNRSPPIEGAIPFN